MSLFPDISLVGFNFTADPDEARASFLNPCTLPYRGVMTNEQHGIRPVHVFTEATLDELRAAGWQEAVTS